jgi:hypothetical protein
MTGSDTTTRLVTSFSGLMARLLAGDIKIADLDADTIYAFSETEGFVTADYKSYGALGGQIQRHVPDSYGHCSERTAYGHRLYARLIECLKHAEVAGRLRWDVKTFGQLNELLQLHGHPALGPATSAQPVVDAIIKEMIADRGLPFSHLGLYASPASRTAAA